MFMRISNYVESLSDEFAFAGSGCGTVQYERDEGAFVLNAYIDIKKDFKKLIFASITKSPLRIHGTGILL